jgi:hypothetical protein
MKYKGIREEELKNKVGADWFKSFDTTEILGNIDFTVFPKQDNLFGRTPLLWAEAKTGDFDVTTMFVQLIITIGKARTFDKTLPPAFIGAFDFKKIAFVSYINVQDIFYLNDFNWNVTPSNHETKEFQLVKNRIESILKQNTYVYDYQKDEKELQTFINNNISKATETSKIKIDKNNFIPIYLRWLEFVKPIIDVNWDDLKKANILDSDFYLADLFVDDKDTQKIEDDLSIRDSLFVVFQNQGYKIAKENIKQMFDATINIKVKETYQQFWKRYKRPPIKEFQDYIIERRDLLVPQDIRERKGAFFTPRKWVELSQKYLADYLGENWQEEYFIWDCAGGTGNLLAGLTNKYNIWVSTLDQADVNVMHERIEHGANLLENHVFQFDFLNDDFTKLPLSLQDILKDEKKRKKLIIYINPPYAEAGDAKQRTGTGKNKSNVSLNRIHDQYHIQLGDANRQLFAQFLIRIYNEIKDCKIAEFSTLKTLSSSHFTKFRSYFKAKLIKAFIVPAHSFDNVNGQFPIGFKIWDSAIKEDFDKISVDVFDEKQNYLGLKTFSSLEGHDYFSLWVNSFKLKSGIKIGWLQGVTRNDFQNQNGIIIKNDKSQIAVPRGIDIYDKNLESCCVCYAVRMCLPANWLNDCDQFLKPNKSWELDIEFKNDCLIYTLFHEKNTIQFKSGVNHWIPFTETEVNASEKFESNFMTDFMKGKNTPNNQTEELMFTTQIKDIPTSHGPLQFSDNSKAVIDAGRELWKYYHSFKNVNVNASLYDIREYFQGRNEKGRMNTRSADEKYVKLIGDLREKLNILADNLVPKIYEYEFLKE